MGEHQERTGTSQGTGCPVPYFSDLVLELEAGELAEPVELLCGGSEVGLDDVRLRRVADLHRARIGADLVSPDERPVIDGLVGAIDREDALAGRGAAVAARAGAGERAFHPESATPLCEGLKLVRVLHGALPVDQLPRDGGGLGARGGGKKREQQQGQDAVNLHRNLRFGERSEVFAPLIGDTTISHSGGPWLPVVGNPAAEPLEGMASG